MRIKLPLTLLTAAVAATAPLHADPLTRDNGAPVGDNQNSKTAGPDGPVLLEDVHLIQKLQRFDRERIPERVVHARGTGAHGYFESTADLSNVTRAALFAGGGKRTPIFVRFSSVIHPSGSPETLRDPRGFAIKFYTEQGNWDLVGNNLPVFFIRDAMKFPDMVHSLKPSPVTNKQDPNRFFDFFSHVPESTHMLTTVYSDLGTPASYRQMDGNSVHAYKLVDAAGRATYAKFRWISGQGVKNFTAEEAGRVQGQDFNVHTTDLYAAIARKAFPTWELRVQLLKPEQLGSFDFDPLDATKVWPDVPWTPIGRLTLDRTPDNFFQETEQSAFAPGNLVPGIEPSEDRLLQGRIFSYNDTHLHRLGANAQSLPINRPLATVRTHHQDGPANVGNTKSDVNYQPSVVQKTPADESAYRYSTRPLAGGTQQQRIAKTLNFRQAGELYRSFAEGERTNLISNLAGDLKQVQNPQVKLRMVSHFYKADADYGRRLAEAVGVSPADAAKAAEGLQE